MYSISKFSRVAGVTVKMLRHYERLGLLTPERTAAGYRRYAMRDLQSLERILALKTLGLPLSTIAALGAGRTVSLRAHLEVLEDRRAKLEHAIDAIKQIERQPAFPDALAAFLREAAWERWEARRQKHASTTPRPPDRAGWSRVALFREMAAVVQQDATSERAGALAKRYRETIGPETLNAIRNRSSWPLGMRRYVASLYETTPEVWERVIALVEASE
jgi:DNA-binding transcriptional MerR regulator